MYKSSFAKIEWDDGLGGQVAYKKACGREHDAGGEHRGKGCIYGVYNGLLVRHAGLVFLIVGGGNYGVVYIGAHLQGLNDHIAQKVQRYLSEGGYGEIYPYTALNYQNEQHRQTHRAESKQKNYNNKKG